MYYVTPILVVFGNISNILTLIVLRRPSLKNHSVCFYMAANALSNFFVLNLLVANAWLTELIDVSVSFSTVLNSSHEISTSNHYFTLTYVTRILKTNGQNR